MSDVVFQPVSLERMVRAVEKVRERLLRAATALERAQVPYAVVGGNAVVAWVSRVDEAAVRNTREVEILLRRSDFDVAKAALEAVGFVYRHAASIDMFLDGPDAKARDAVHVIFAAEKVKRDDAVPAPDVTESEPEDSFRVLALEPLVRLGLTANSLNDRVDLRDLMHVGLIDATWPVRFPGELGARLQHLLDTPEG